MPGAAREVGRPLVVDVMVSLIEARHCHSHVHLLTYTLTYLLIQLFTNLYTYLLIHY